jgi:CBS domain containing-hemolysin-like protein
LETIAPKAINLLDNLTNLNALEQMRKESTHIAFVVAQPLIECCRKTVGSRLFIEGN